MLHTAQQVMVFALQHRLPFMYVAAVPGVPRFIRPVSAVVLQIRAAYK